MVPSPISAPEAMTALAPIWTSFPITALSSTTAEGWIPGANTGAGGAKSAITEENAKSLLSDAGIVCEAFDNAECKAMLTNTVLSEMRDKYLVAASGMAGLNDANRIKTRKITSKFYLCGDEESDVANGIGLVSSRVALCASHQAHTVLRILAKQFDV